MGSHSLALGARHVHTSLPVTGESLSFKNFPNQIALKVYQAWFCANKWLVETFKRFSLPAVGVSLGMLLLEGHTLCKAAWFTCWKYRLDPKEYGFEQIEKRHRGKNPVLLFHGAAGSWNYLGDLASELSKADIPVFVINLGGGDVTEEKRKLVCKKIEQIRTEYAKRLHVHKPKVDLVAHSMGSNVAMATAFARKCSSIDEQGELHFRRKRTVRAHSSVGKVITIANPSNAQEVKRISQAGKRHQLFNINARYDALMGHKTCALTGRLARQAAEVDAGHVGIVFQSSASAAVRRALRVFSAFS
jgi:pimeloyl-ACP methyl ester carboxylesterase